MESRQSIILNKIPFELDSTQLEKKLHIEAGSDFAADLADLITTALKIARPKACYRIGYIDAKHDEAVTIDGICFNSRVLRVNLDAVHRVFASVATCGTELETWANSIEDVLHRFWADTIKEWALRAAFCFLKEHLEQVFQLGTTSAMSPGSLKDWPIEQQIPLFQLLGDTKTAIGVELTPSFLMLPTKSVSGIRFPAKDNFESCQLCPRENCPGRRLPYNPDLFQKKYELIPH
jgi:hypothetical protein